MTQSIWAILNVSENVVFSPTTPAVVSFSSSERVLLVKSVSKFLIFKNLNQNKNTYFKIPFKALQ